MSKLNRLRKEVTLTVDGEPFTVNIRKVSTADVLKYMSSVPSLYNDLVPSEIREAIRESAGEEADAEKALQGLIVATGIIVAGSVDPKFCLESSVDCLSPMELEDSKATDFGERLKPIFTLAEEIMRFSGLEGVFRSDEQAKEGVPKKAKSKGARNTRSS